MKELTDQERRKMWRRYCLEHERVFEEWRERDYCHPPPKYPAFPTECIGMACGATTRTGTPCKRRDIWLNGRCKLSIALHGFIIISGHLAKWPLQTARGIEHGADLGSGEEKGGSKRLETEAEEARPMRG